MIVASYLLIWAGIALYALSCLCPLIAARTESAEKRGHLAALDGALTVAATLVFSFGFHHFWIGLLVAILAQIVMASAYKNAVGPEHVSPYTRKPIGE